MSNFNLFASMHEHMTRMNTQTKGIDLGDIWKFRAGINNDPLFHRLDQMTRELREHVVTHRINRAAVLAEGYAATIGKIREERTNIAFLGDIDSERQRVEHALVEAAKFDYGDNSFDGLFDILEIALTNENPLYVYEVFDWLLNNHVEPVNAVATAADKLHQLQQLLSVDLPPFIKMVIDAVGSIRQAEVAHYADTQYGYEDKVTRSDETNPASGEDTAPKTDAPEQTVHVDAAPVEAAQGVIGEDIKNYVTIHKREEK